MKKSDQFLSHIEEIANMRAERESWKEISTTLSIHHDISIGPTELASYWSRKMKGRSAAEYLYETADERACIKYNRRWMNQYIYLKEKLEQEHFLWTYFIIDILYQLFEHTEMIFKKEVFGIANKKAEEKSSSLVAEARNREQQFWQYAQVQKKRAEDAYKQFEDAKYDILHLQNALKEEADGLHKVASCFKSQLEDSAARANLAEASARACHARLKVAERLLDIKQKEIDLMTRTESYLRHRLNKLEAAISN